MENDMSHMMPYKDNGNIENRTVYTVNYCC